MGDRQICRLGRVALPNLQIYCLEVIAMSQILDLIFSRASSLWRLLRPVRLMVALVV